MVLLCDNMLHYLNSPQDCPEQLAVQSSIEGYCNRTTHQLPRYVHIVETHMLPQLAL
jgi:hypothetical protein